MRIAVALTLLIASSALAGGKKHAGKWDDTYKAELSEKQGLLNCPDRVDVTVADDTIAIPISVTNDSDDGTHPIKVQANGKFSSVVKLDNAKAARTKKRASISIDGRVKVSGRLQLDHGKGRYGWVKLELEGNRGTVCESGLTSTSFKKAPRSSSPTSKPKP